MCSRLIEALAAVSCGSNKLKGHMWPRQPLVVIQSLDSVNSALMKLCDEDIYSMPVVDVYQRYVGIVDLKDIANMLVSKSRGLDFKQVDARKRVKDLMKTTIVYDIIQPKYNPIPIGSSLLLAFNLMAWSRKKRIAVTNEHGRCVCVITQSMLIEYFAKNIEQLGDIASTKLRNILNKTERVLITVESHQATIEAFALMVELQVSGVAIIDPTTDAMVGAISLKDLRGAAVDTSLLANLARPVSVFKACGSSNKESTSAPSTSVEADDAFQSGLCSSLDDTLSVILETMSSLEVKRVFVLDEKKRPVHVITSTDVLHFLFKALNLAKNPR